MCDAAKVVAKVLVLDGDARCVERIQLFCDENNIVGINIDADKVMSALDSNGDLGGVFLSEHFADEAFDGIALGQMIYKSRPGLPIFLRRETSEGMEDLSEDERRPFFGAYNVDTMAKLRPVMDQTIFSGVFPSALVQGLTEISRSALESQFINMTAEVEAPHVVMDKFVFGELFSLIPVESSWCRGYMMLQVEEESLVKLVRAHRTHARVEQFDDYGHLNSILSEVTNLIWGEFKNRYVAESMVEKSLPQVPLIMNHYHSSISFGSDSPQLCLKYTMRDQTDPTAMTFVLYQKFVFNLKWDPENFYENDLLNNAIDAGEMEMF